MALRKRNGIYHCDFMVNGERYRMSLGTKDRREAQKLEKEKIADALQGKLTPHSLAFTRLGFEQAAELHLTDRRPYLAPRTVTTEGERVKPLRRFFGNTKLRAIGPDQVRQYIDHRLRAGMANKTVNLELELLRGMVKRAKRWHLVADEIKMLPVNHDTGRALEVDEKLRFLKAAASSPNWQVAKCASILALNTTMRKCEIRGLQWRNVDLMDRTLTVWRKTTKTAAGERRIPLNDDALAAILEMRERAKLLFGDSLSPDWFVFFRHPGNSWAPDPARPMGYTAWRTAFRKIIMKAELPGLRFHDLRHHAITELAEGQASDMTIMSIAGHISKRMLEHYSHTRMDAKRKALEVLSMQRQSQATNTELRHKAVTIGNSGAGQQQSSV